MSKGRHLPQGWDILPLEQVCELNIGKTPSRKERKYWQDGIYPWATIGDMSSATIYETAEQITDSAVEESNIKLVPAGTVILSFKLSMGKVAFTGTDLYTNEAIVALAPKTEKLLNEYLFYFAKAFDLEKASRVAVKGKTVNKSILSDLPVILPPIAVQERIVQILQKADDIRRKRREAMKIAEAMLPALFYETFGDPLAGTNNFYFIALGEIADVRSGVTKGRKLDEKTTTDVPYLRVANVQDGFLNLSEIKTIEALEKDLEKYALEDGDVLMTEGGDPDKLGRGTVWRNEIVGCIYQNHIFRVRTDRERLLPEFLATLLRMQYSKSYFLGCAKRSSNLASINSRQVKQFPIPLPPLVVAAEIS